MAQIGATGASTISLDDLSDVVISNILNGATGNLAIENRSSSYGLIDDLSWTMDYDGTPYVFVAQHLTDNHAAWKNGVEDGDTTTTSTTSPFVNLGKFELGQINGVSWGGSNFYGGGFVLRALTDNERVKLETHLNSKSGAY